jgi:hypothetical protein
MLHVTQDNIAVLHKNVDSLFPGVDSLHIQKKDVQKNETYNQLVKKHFRMTQHECQVRKCDNQECCDTVMSDRGDVQ